MKPRLTKTGWDLTVCRFPRETAVPAAIPDCPLYSISRTPDELSLVCPSDQAPPAPKSEAGWTCLRVEGPLDFSLTGILSSILNPLAAAGIPIFALSTFDTDYVLVKQTQLTRTLRALESAGFEIR